ncbi:Late embryogenesis abundant protein, LEA_1 subgroup [Dillenia turbinata]|uniref:Late embryogenesis abundant protein, LEA_1 subgroup n=1 Tax=Dillenia turbinata TaxID=194707 RepID=A0AAN8WCE7_9MAGN
MQGARNAAEAVKETAANIGASAKASMEKTKAVVQEKTDKMTAHTPMEKEMAKEKKNVRVAEAEYRKQEVKESNAAARQAATAPGGHPKYSSGETDYTTGTGSYTHSTTGATAQPTGTHEMSATPGHGSGAPAGSVIEGIVGSRPIGIGTGTGGTTAQNTRVEGREGTGYGTGGGYA